MPIDFTLSETQQQLQAGARAFARGRLTDVAAAIDHLPTPDLRFRALKPFYEENWSAPGSSRR